MALHESRTAHDSTQIVEYRIEALEMPDLHEHTGRFCSRFEFAPGGERVRERFLHEHVDACGCGGDADLGVQHGRHRDADRVDARQKVVNVGRNRAALLFGHLTRSRLVAIKNSDQLCCIECTIFRCVQRA
jgi:hypothetical protein